LWTISHQLLPFHSLLSSNARVSFCGVVNIEAVVQMRVLRVPVKSVSPSTHFQAKRRQLFSPDEDVMLTRLVQQFGIRAWEQITWFMPHRTARQCRDRYKNYLNELNHSVRPWTSDEDDAIRARFGEMGPKWVEIAHHLPGRCGNDVKHRWYTHLAKALDDSVPHRRSMHGESPPEQWDQPQSGVVEGPKLDPQFVREFRQTFLEAMARDR
jgi:hypothetical protein